MTLLGALVVLLHLRRRNLDFLHTYVHTYIHTHTHSHTHMLTDSLALEVRQQPGLWCSCNAEL